MRARFADSLVQPAPVGHHGHMPEPGGAVTLRTALPSGSVIVITLAAALVCALTMRELTDVLAPVLLALILSIAVAPVRRFVRAKGGPAWLATIAALVAVYVIVALLAWSALALLTHFGSLVASYSGDVEQIVRDWIDDLAAAGIDQDRLTTLTSSLDLGKAADVVLALLGGLTGVLSSLLFVIVLLFFTIADTGSFVDGLARLGVRGARLSAIFRSFAQGTRSYLVVATVFGAIVALVDVGVLMALGVRDAWLWGLLAFLTNYIPNIGFIIGVVPPAFIALVDQGPGTAIAVVAAYCVINFVLQTIVQPRVVGRAVGLTATLSFLSLLWWGAIFGGIGAIIAVPLTLLVKAALIDSDPDRSWLRPLLESGDEDPEPESLHARPEPAEAPTTKE